MAAAPERLRAAGPEVPGVRLWGPVLEGGPSSLSPHAGLVTVLPPLPPVKHARADTQCCLLRGEGLQLPERPLHNFLPAELASLSARPPDC